MYLVTDTRLCGEFGVAATVAAAVAAGVTVVQLRDPEIDDDGFVLIGRAVAAALAGTGVPLIVNDRVHLVTAIGGVDADRAALVRRTGAAGVAVVSAICGQPDVAAATSRIRSSWDSAVDVPGRRQAESR